MSSPNLGSAHSLTRLRNADVTITFKNDKRILSHAVSLHNAYVQDLIQTLGADSFETLVFFQPLPAFLSNISAREGGNMLGLESMQQNAIIYTAGVAIKTDRADLAVAQSKMNVMLADLQSFAASVDGSERLVYMNYADSSQDPLGSYGRDNVDFIRRVAETYDPTGAFQRRFPGGFKISRVEG